MHKNKLNFLILIVGLFFSCKENKNTMSNFQKDTIMVPNEETAIKIAEAVWLPIYGKIIENNKPFKAVLKDNNTWVVEGTLHTSRGGVPYIEIARNNGKILKVTHGK